MNSVRRKNAIGWLGVIILLLAYFGITVGGMVSTEPPYNLLNLLGGSLLAWRVWQDKNYSNFVFEVIFISIAIFALIKHFYEISF